VIFGGKKVENDFFTCQKVEKNRYFWHQNCEKLLCKAAKSYRSVIFGALDSEKPLI